MAKKKASSTKGASFVSGKKKRVTKTQFTTPIADEPKPAEKPHVKKQTSLEGNGFDLPPAIQSIENAADELFDIEDKLKADKEKKEKVVLTVIGLMRAANRTIYTYRDRTIRIEGKEKLTVKAPKHRKPRKSRIGLED